MSPPLAIPRGSLVLVTGATGYIGSWVVHEFVKQGYRVRLGVRSAEKASILSAAIEKEFGPNHVETSIITDFTHPLGYKEAIQDVAGVVHLATETSFSPDPDVVVTSTVNALKGLLGLAKNTPSVKRFVLTSSSRALAVHNPGSGFIYSSKVWNQDAVDKMYTANDGTITYSASKTLGEQAFWEGDVPFVRNTVLPDTTIGPAVDDKLRSSTHGWLRGMWDNDPSAYAPLQRFPQGYYVNVQDIARLHVGATIFEEVQGKRLLGFADKFTWNGLLDSMRELDAKRVLPDKVDIVKDTTDIEVDESLKVLKLFDQDAWIGYNETIKQNLE